MPYARPGADTNKYTDLYLNPGETPNDLDGDGNTFKFAATSDPSNGPQINSNPFELFGVRGAHIADADPTRRTPPGRPPPAGPTSRSRCSTRASSGTTPGAMSDLRLQGPPQPAASCRCPRHDLAHGDLRPGQNDCSTFAAQHDANGDGVFNIDDYACDAARRPADRPAPRRPGRTCSTPEDLIIAFSDGTDADRNGFVDDIAGWDFLDNDNDPFDDVQYGHGTGEAHDSTRRGRQRRRRPARARTAWSCRCGSATASSPTSTTSRRRRSTPPTTASTSCRRRSGTLNNSTLAREAVDYAYRHGVTVIASAADEAAQHHNWPSIAAARDRRQLGHDRTPRPTPDQSYLPFNGCTNFNAKVTLAIPSTSCSSDATGLAAGMAGLVYSRGARRAERRAPLSDYPEPPACQRTDGSPCVITPNEVRQLMAIGHDRRRSPRPTTSTSRSAAGEPEPSCSPAPAPGCTDPDGPAARFRTRSTRTGRPRSARPALFQSYPGAQGPDQFYGYGRVNMAKALDAVLSDPTSPAPSQIPPEAEITSPQWYQQVDPSNATISSRRATSTRAAPATRCEVLVAPGQYPNNDRTTASPPGDFEPSATAGATAPRSHTRIARDRSATITIADAEVAVPARRPTSTAPSRRPARPTTTGGPTPRRTRSPSRSSSTRPQRRPRR